MNYTAVVDVDVCLPAWEVHVLWQWNVEGGAWPGRQLIDRDSGRKTRSASK
jgi:hypothetical protein